MASQLMAFGTYDSSTHPRFGVLLEGLRSTGHDVIEVNQPLGLDTAARVRLLQQPWRLPVLAARLASRWVLLAARGLRAYRSASPAAVLVGYLGHFDVVLARVLFPQATVVLDHLIFAADTARDRNAGGRLVQFVLRGLDRLALRCADVIVLDTDEHRALLPADLRGRSVVCPVGAPSAWFEAAHPSPDSDPGKPLRVAFFGLFTPLQGAATIAAAIRALSDRDDIRWTMVGRGQDWPAARAAIGDNPLVEWRDWVTSAELPQLVAAHDVCLGIFGSGAKALRVVPNKVFQGAAAGCAVLTSDTPPQRRCLGADAVFVPPADAAALAAAVTRLAEDRHGTDRLRHTLHERATREFTPAAVSAPLRDALARPHPNRQGTR